MGDTKDGAELELDARYKARGAALIGKIYTAQKDREESIKKRLKQVTEEREELTKKLKRLEKDHNGIDSGMETNSIDDELWLKADSMSLDEIVGLVINGKQSKSIESNGEPSVDRGGGSSMSGNKTPRNKSSSSCGDMRKLQAERDTALQQVDQLTTELHEAQRERSMFETQHRRSEKKRLNILQNQMKGVLKERDEAIAKTEILQHELKRERIHSRLTGSEIYDTRHKLNSTLEEYQHKMDMDEREKNEQKIAYNELYNRLTQVVDEKNQLSLKVQETQVMFSEEKKRAEKLERLLIALRRRKER